MVASMSLGGRVLYPEMLGRGAGSDRDQTPSPDYRCSLLQVILAVARHPWVGSGAVVGDPSHH